MKDTRISEYAIKIENLSKKFGSFEAVSDVTLYIPKGEIFALIGPNGAGKTTLIKMLVGLLKPDQGNFKIFGKDIGEEPETVKKTFGYISDNPIVYEYLSGLEFLYLTGTLRGIEKSVLDKKIKELKKIFPLGEVIYQPMAEYSRGNRQKLAFLAAILDDPQLLIIDEPVVGLDPSSIKILGTKLQQFVKKGETVFFVTHILSFAQDYATRVALMDKGKIIKEEKVTKNISLESIYQLV